MRRASSETRHGWLRRDGWVVLVLGTLAEGYLAFALAMTTIAVLPLALGWQGSVVQTGSMAPHVRPGDVVLSTELSDDSPVPLGGVVEFRTLAPDGGERTVMHRIVAEGETRGEWITAGDANADVDSSTLTRDDITGQARLLVRWVGLPSIWLRDGAFVHMLAWAAVTLASVALVGATWPYRRGAAPAAPTRPRGSSTSAAEVTRRTFLAAAFAVTAGGTALVSREPVWAAFTARTTTAGTFRVGTWPTLGLGRVASFLVLAATRVTNNAFLGIGSSVGGNVGVSPGITVLGFWLWDITGSTERNTATARNARTDALQLYADALDRPHTGPATGPAPTLSGTVRPVVLHRAGPLQVTGTLTLDARGDSSALFVFSGTTFTFAPGSTVVLANGASADRVLFVSTSTVSVEENATVRGIVLAHGDVAANRATVAGRLVSLHGSVGLTRVGVAAP